MREKLGEPLNADQLSTAACMSRCHFIRAFAMVTGVSPGRFLTAIRMQEAKRLLLNTDRSVTDISLDVGYNSLGTFTRIFADFVGLPPARFRQLSLALFGLMIDDVIQFLPPKLTENGPESLAGEVLCDRPLACVVVALFPTVVPRSLPIDCVCLKTAGAFSLRRSSKGGRILAVGLPPGAALRDVLGDRVVGNVVGNVDARPQSGKGLSLRLREVVATDPPLVVAFPLLMLTKYSSLDLSALGEDARS